MHNPNSDFLIRALGLLLIIVVIHSFYTVVVRPNAEYHQSSELQAQKSTSSIWVIVKDYEQESCFILLFWALLIITLKWRHNNRELLFLQKNLIPLSENAVLLPEDTILYTRTLTEQNLEKHLLPRTLCQALLRFNRDRSVTAVANTIKDECDIEAERLESEMSIIRYITWAIPSIGFIGTVRGIGMALEKAHLAVAGDISSVTSLLGIAFNSTYVALLISIVLMFIIHQLTSRQERCVHETMRYCQNHLLAKLQVTS